MTNNNQAFEENFKKTEIYKREIAIRKDNIMLFSPTMGGYFNMVVNDAFQLWQLAKEDKPSPWVIGGFPELEKSENSDCLISKEVFFEMQFSGSTYHGWYIARPVDRPDDEFFDGDEDDEDVEYEYFFNSNVGDELFDEDMISRWMYVPEPREKNND